jgi:hypothetical protein
VFIKSLVLSTTLLVVCAASAATPPKVVFYGDQTTVNWPLPAGYINQGVPGYSNGPGSSQGLFAYGAAAAFQSDVVSLHPTIVHIMIGQNDANEAHDADYQLKLPEVLSAMATMVQEAKAANIKVVIGSIIGGGSLGTAINEALAGFAAANGIQFLNYSDLLGGGVESTGGGTGGAVYFPTVVGPNAGQCSGPGGACSASLLTTFTAPNNFGVEIVPSVNGYALMTQMAEVAIAQVMGATIKGGYLQNQTLPTTNVYSYPANVNNGANAGQLQFTPVAVFSDGSTHPLLNSTLAGSSGTWKSSNPQGAYITQTGLLTMFNATSIITYTAPNGVQFAEWIMY